MMDEFKTTVIGFDKNAGEVQEVETQPTRQININDEKEENVIKNVLFNVTTTVPHVTTSIPAVEVKETLTQEEVKKAKYKSIQQINKNYSFIPKFYLKELKRYKFIMFMWVVLTILCFGLEIWALLAILNKQGLSNWVALTLIPAPTLCIAFLVVYINNYLNYRSEARNVDFSKEKVVTTNVLKLYKRLKTGYININWFCLLTYVASLLCIGIDYLCSKGIDKTWSLSPSAHNGIHAYQITLIVAIVAIFVALFAHIFLLVANYTRAAKIDNFYSIQIVSDEELTALKKKKNKRNVIIFIAVIICIALIGMLIYKIANRKKQTNNITINN